MISKKGKTISGIDQCEGSLVFHAGTAEKNGNVVTSGGRVIAITTLGNTISDALKISMQNAAAIKYDQKYYRKDIGRDLL